jgi:L-fuconolactonase
MQIDAHQHFWRLDRGDYDWLDSSLAPIHRDFLPEDLAPLLAQAGVDRTVLVQAAPTAAETDFLLDLAGAAPFVAGVVGWADLEASTAADRIAELAGREKLLGLRPMIQDLADADWMLRPSLAPAFAAIVDFGLRFDALVKPTHLPILLTFARRHPALRIVIDHGGKPDIAAGRIEAWRRDIGALAGEPNVVCKLSGLVTEAAPSPAASDLRPYVDALLHAFGPARLMWGSDWPVLNLNGDYAGWRRTAQLLLSKLSDDERAAVFGGTAEAFYGIAAG